jgi:hypothetical protein
MNGGSVVVNKLERRLPEPIPVSRITTTNSRKPYRDSVQTPFGSFLAQASPLHWPAERHNPLRDNIQVVFCLWEP